jgi:molybdopterin biosynthesis enzyme MoaB
MKQELIDLLENYGIEDAKQEAIIDNIQKIIKNKLSVIDEGSLNGECSIVVLSGGEKHSFVAGWKRYEEFAKSYLGI